MNSYDAPPHLLPISSDARRFNGSVEYIADQQWAPTPLDPYSVNRDGENYVHAAQSSLIDRVTQKADQSGLPATACKRALAELDAALDVRVDRNIQSYQRLLVGIDLDGADDDLIAIIEKARGGAANPAELLRLIKEHPEMISVEFFKRTTPFDPKEYHDAQQALFHIVATLKNQFADAEFTLDAEGPITAEPFTTEHGAIVWKQKIGEAKSVGSHVEIIVKNSMIALPPDAQLTNGVSAMKRSDGTTVAYLLPLGISAYFRTADYKSRVGYTSPENEHREELSEDLRSALGKNAIHIDETLNQIPPEMREAFLQGVRSVSHDDEPASKSEHDSEFGLNFID